MGGPAWGIDEACARLPRRSCLLKLANGELRSPTPRAQATPPWLALFLAVNGLKAAKAAGCFAVAVCTSLPAHMLAAQADAVVERLVDLDLAAVQPAAAQGDQPPGDA